MLVVLSDGIDTASLVTFDAVADIARRLGVADYTVSLQLQHGPAAIEDPGFKAAYETRTLARETGSRSFVAGSIEDLDGIYGSIARELAHQYTVGYVSNRSAEPGSFTRVSITVDHSNVRVRTRTGYIAGT